VDTDEVVEPRARNSLIVFLVLTFALSSIFYIRSFSGAPRARATAKSIQIEIEAGFSL
jgi:hypothetical protein